MQGLHLVPRLTARENALIGALNRLRGADAWCSVLRWYPPALVTVVPDLELLPRLATRVVGLANGRVQWDRPIDRVTSSMLQVLYPGRAGGTEARADRRLSALARLARLARA